MSAPRRFFLLLAIAIAFLFELGASAETGTLLHSFNELPNGYLPYGGLLSDAKGNFYGVVSYGGAIGTGGVYKVSPNPHGGWTQTMIYSFGLVGAGGPVGSLIMDSAGNLYGLGSGAHGTVFELTPQSNGQWSESTILTFLGENGSFPVGGLVMDSSGNLYGVTEYGGPQSCGTAYRLSPGPKGWTQTLLYSFQCSPNLWYPDGALILDSNGNLYGTTAQGGAGYGTVYELSPSSSGWSAQVLYAFSGGSDGNTPAGAIVVDRTGNVFGAAGGGTGTGCNSDPCGVIFELTPTLNGNWTEKVIHNFSGPDGAFSSGNLVLDGDGNLYGSTVSGGLNDLGLVFELTPGTIGWTESVLWTFTGGKDGSGANYGVILGGPGKVYGVAMNGGGANGNGAIFELSAGNGGQWTEKTLANFADGSGNPQVGLTPDGHGNFYGTTNSGGAHGFGVVYEMSPEAGGDWKFTIVYSFMTGYYTNQHGYGASASQLVFDSAGNLYGETGYGGTSDHGMVFELSPSGDGEWIGKDLYNFKGGTDGSTPLGGLTLDAAGNLYGTTELGGNGTGCHYAGCGTVFELSLSGGSWGKTILYNFQGGITDGSSPMAGVIFGKNGKLYGTTFMGGIGQEYTNCGAGCGSMFELSPSSGTWKETFVYLFSEIHGDGASPTEGLIMDDTGNLFGTTSTGGLHNLTCGLGCGTVFEFTHAAGGGWTENVIYEFPGPASAPPSGLIIDYAGNLYGANLSRVFELTPAGGGKWNESTLFTLSHFNVSTAYYPIGNLALDSEGNLYGTTPVGGLSDWGTVFRITP